MSCLTLLALFVFAASVVTLVFRMLGLVFGLAFDVLPLLCIALVVAFFVQGGKIDIELPEKWRKK